MRVLLCLTVGYYTEGNLISVNCDFYTHYSTGKEGRSITRDISRKTAEKTSQRFQYGGGQRERRRQMG